MARQNRTEIANFATALKCFTPTETILVNEKNKKQERIYKELTDEAPSRNQLIGMAQAAMSQVVAFIKDHEALKESYQNVTADAMMAYVEGQKYGIFVDSLAELFDATLGKAKKAYDVIKTLLEKTDDAKVRETCEKFLATFPLERTGDENPPIITFPGAQAKPDGEN